MCNPMRFALAGIIVLTLGACNTPAATPKAATPQDTATQDTHLDVQATDATGQADGATADARVTDAGMADAATPFACACEEAEDCLGCYQRIATCCYDDPTWMGQVERLAGNCERDGSCRTCCNECLARSCDELKASHHCPL